jgi:ribosome-associated protein
VLVDLGDMIVHIMQAPIRAYYRLEELWGDKPVKVGAAKRKSTDEGEEAAKPKKISSHMAAGKKEAEVKPVIEKKTPARKAAAAKPAAVKKPAAKKAAAVPAGKTIKVGKTKSAVAAAEVLKALPPKRKVAKPKADEAPVKTVIKRIKKVEE